MKPILIAVALCLAACGSDPEVPPPPPEVVAVHEVCTVTIQPDGSLVCTCVLAAPVAQ